MRAADGEDEPAVAPPLAWRGPAQSKAKEARLLGQRDDAVGVSLQRPRLVQRGEDALVLHQLRYHGPAERRERRSGAVIAVIALKRCVATQSSEAART